MTRISALLAALMLASPAISNNNTPAAAPVGQLIYLPAKPANVPANFVAVPVSIWSNGQVFMQWMLIPSQAIANMPAVSGSAPAATATTAAATAASLPAAAVSVPSVAAAAAVNVAGKITGSTATHARAITATCYACHGTDGKSHTAIPALAGMEAGYFIQQMKDFKSGKREATVMHQHARGYTEEEFQQVADVFAAIKP